MNGTLKAELHSLKTLGYNNTNFDFKNRVIVERQPVGYPGQAMCNRVRFLPTELLSGLCMKP